MSSHFAFITDNHHNGTQGARQILEALVPQVNALDPDFIIHGGDIVAAGRGSKVLDGGYLTAIQEAADLLKGFRGPLHIIPGNHDGNAEDGALSEFSAHIPIPDLLDVVEAGPGLRLALANVFTVEPFKNAEGVWTDAHDTALKEAAADALGNRCALLLITHTMGAGTQASAGRDSSRSR